MMGFCETTSPAKRVMTQQSEICAREKGRKKESKQLRELTAMGCLMEADSSCDIRYVTQSQGNGAFDLRRPLKGRIYFGSR